jgi:hypothetical protein
MVILERKLLNYYYYYYYLSKLGAHPIFRFWLLNMPPIPPAIPFLQNVAFQYDNAPERLQYEFAVLRTRGWFDFEFSKRHRTSKPFESRCPLGQVLVLVVVVFPEALDQFMAAGDL